MKIPCPRLIEVALPVRETSAETECDKSLRHAHPRFVFGGPGGRWLPHALVFSPC